MPLSRREWLAATGIGIAGAKAGFPLSPVATPPLQDMLQTSPWLEIDPLALAHNARTLSRLAGGRPILAMVKNNCYGLGLETVPPLLDRLEEIWGFGVVRPIEAETIRNAGVKKPIVLLGPASEEEAIALIRRGVRLTASGISDAARFQGLAKKLGQPVPIHLYVDTGMHRMGMPHRAVLDWLDSADIRRSIRIEGALTELVEDQEFDREQSARLTELARTGASRGVPFGKLHAACSDTIVRPTPEAFLDLVRPGLALYGGYPTAESFARAELRLSYSLKARVIRVDRLETGEGVSYHRRFMAKEPTETATLAIGHVDGYPTGATGGAEVLIGGRLFPVIAVVTASHTVVNLGLESGVKVGDQATLVGPEHEAIHPNVVAERSGYSQYNMFMHLNPGLGKRIAG